MQTSVSILFVGYLLMQVPSNLFLNKIGKPALYLPTCMVVWGIISGATAACHNYAGLIACRFMLGFVEAAYFVRSRGPLKLENSDWHIFVAWMSVLPLMLVHETGTWVPDSYILFWSFDQWCFLRLDCGRHSERNGWSSRVESMAMVVYRWGCHHKYVPPNIWQHTEIHTVLQIQIQLSTIEIICIFGLTNEHQSVLPLRHSLFCQIFLAQHLGSPKKSASWPSGDWKKISGKMIGLTVNINLSWLGSSLHFPMWRLTFWWFCFLVSVSCGIIRSGSVLDWHVINSGKWHSHKLLPVSSVERNSHCSSN